MNKEIKSEKEKTQGEGGGKFLQLTRNEPDGQLHAAEDVIW